MAATSEVRGIRLIVGYAVSIAFTYWYLTGRVWLPFTESIAMRFAPETMMVSTSPDGTYGGPIADAFAIVSAVAYIVGTVTCWALLTSWSLIGSFFSAASDQFTGGRALAEQIEVDRAQKVDSADSQERVSDAAVGHGVQQQPPAVDHPSTLESRLTAVETFANALNESRKRHRADIQKNVTSINHLQETKTDRRKPKAEK